MKGYKGFNKDMKCLDMQYEIGKTFTYAGTVSLCNRGLHFCEHPLDILSYYRPNDGSIYSEVVGDDVSKKTEGDSKRVAKSLTVKAKIEIPALIKAAISFVFEKVSATTGYSAHSATTGYSAHSAVKGEQCIAASFGVQGQAKGSIGNWLVLAEWVNGEIKAMGIAHIDGNKIKADVFYVLKNGKFMEAE